MKKPSTFSIRNIAFALAAALSLAILPTAQAQLIVYDGFGYPAGSVVGQNGGIGWVTPNLTGMYGATWTDSSWQNPANVPWLPAAQTMYNQRPTADQVVTSPSLTYANSGYSLTTSGNTLDFANKSAMRAWGIPSSFTTGSGNDLWASFLIQPGTLNNLFVLPFGNAGYTVSGTNYQYGAGARLAWNSGTSVYDLGMLIRTFGTAGGYPNPSSTIPLSSGQNYFVVMKFTYNGGTTADTAQLWVNPTLGVSGPQGGDLTTGPVSGALDLSGYWFLRAGTSSLNSYVDEFRIGDTYADVTPVPEPSTLALSLIGGVMGLVVFRRRAKALNPRQ